MLNKKNILITGGTGSFGKKFVDLVLRKYKPKKLIIYSRDEQKQFQIKEKWTDDNDSPLRYLYLSMVRRRREKFWVFSLIKENPK